jgi:hypothetical protein
MRLVHNYYVDFLKSFKKFVSNIYGDAEILNINGEETVGGIKHYEFNYASRSILQYKLYKHINFEYPTCIINITDIQTDNTHPMRFNSGIYTPEIVQTLGTNLVTDEQVVTDYRWVTIQLNMKINFETGSDVLNYYDRLNNLPIGFMFYSYKYESFLDATELLSGDDYKNFTNLYIQPEPTQTDTTGLRAWFSYQVEPIFKLNSKQNVINNDTNEFNINVDLECQLKIPVIIARTKNANQLVKRFEIVIANTFNADSPLLIDSDMVYIDNLNRLSHNFILQNKNFSIITENEEEFLLINAGQISSFLTNKYVSIYLNSDVTDSDPKVINETLGLFEDLKTNKLIIEDVNSTGVNQLNVIFKLPYSTYIQLVQGYLSFTSLSDIRLLAFDPPQI